MMLFAVIVYFVQERIEIIVSSRAVWVSYPGRNKFRRRTQAQWLRNDRKLEVARLRHYSHDSTGIADHQCSWSIEMLKLLIL